MKNIRLYETYLFDADGTLFDTTDLICRCFQNTASVLFNKTLSREEILPNIGLTLRDSMNLHFGPLTDEQFGRSREFHMNYQISIYKEYLRLYPGIFELLKTLKEKNRKCAVVTSRTKTTLDLYLKETGIISFFDVFVTPETTIKHKPDPEPALKALELLGTGSEDALFIGDSTFDIECGAAAGTDTVYAVWNGSSGSPLKIQPTFILSDPLNLLLKIPEKTITHGIAQ